MYNTNSLTRFFYCRLLDLVILMITALKFTMGGSTFKSGLVHFNNVSEVRVNINSTVCVQEYHIMLTLSRCNKSAMSTLSPGLVFTQIFTILSFTSLVFIVILLYNISTYYTFNILHHEVITPMWCQSVTSYWKWCVTSLFCHFPMFFRVYCYCIRLQKRIIHLPFHRLALKMSDKSYQTCHRTA
jgi:hypothetical protein